MKRVSSLLMISLLPFLAIAGCTGTPAQSTEPSQTREYHVFTSTIDFNESNLGISHDIFSPDLIVAHKGDTLVIHYHNLEDTTEHHTFTMGAPYEVNKDVAPNEEVNMTFTLSTSGLFTYVCTFHQPTMTGHLLVTS